MSKKFIYSVFLRHRWKLLSILLLGVFWSLRDIATPYLVKLLIDDAHHLESQILLRILSMIVMIWVAMEFFMRLQGFFVYKTLPRIRTELSEKLLAQLKSYPYPFFLKKMSGTLSERISGVAYGLETLLSIALMAFAPIFAHLVFSLLLVSTVSLSYAAIFSFWMLLHLVLTWNMGLKSLEKTAKVAHLRSQLQGKIVDTLVNIFTIKTFSRERHELSYLRFYQNEELEATQTSQKYLEKIRFILGISSIAMLTGVLSLSYYQFKQFYISIGDLTLLIMLLLNLTSHLWYLSMEMIRFNEEFGRVRENLGALLLEAKNSLPIVHPQLPAFGSIQIKNLFFAYDKPLIENLSFSIEAGKKVALTGLSGSGKTTLINLLLSHYPLQEGEILINGVNISKLNPHKLREHFALTPQHSSLFHRTVRENIQYGKLDASEDEIVEAAKIANCHDFIMQLRDGYDTVLGERGDRLSGGQKQRIAIARALLKDSPVLILDEPTSALDTQTAMQTLANILKARPQQTLLVITHNRDVAGLMDEVIEIT